MINITITQKITTDTPIRRNVIKTKTPTEIKITKRSQYSEPTEEVQFAETYEVVDGLETKTTILTLLTQEISDDSAFDLKSVIAAINKIPEMGKTEYRVGKSVPL